MGRWLAIDHGRKRMGVAVGDSQRGIASPLEGLSATDPDTVGRIAQLAEEYQVAGVVVGWPLKADGTEGAQAKLSKAFAAELGERTGLDVRLWDETLSSFEADQRLSGQLTREKKKRRHDAVAAAAFLEDFLRSAGQRNAPCPGEVRE